MATTGSDTSDDPWRLTTAPGTGAYQMWRDEDAERATYLVTPTGSGA